MSDRIIVRFAPSPTGFLHVGGARSALFNYIFAKQNKGKVILRIEDTDKERNKPEYTDGIINAFKWLGLEFDEVIIQSQNTPIHKKYLEKLIAKGHAYVSKEELKEKDGPSLGTLKRSEVIRFKNPNKKIKFTDLVKGEVEFDTTELGDFVIAKSVDEPIFHLANVVDDMTEGITHVIRGEEHLSNTPRQILIWEGIGERPRPVYAHIPLILSAEREKISKRKHGEIVSVEYYRGRGYLPEALINFLVFLGWNPGGTKEVFSLQEIVEIFDIHKVQKAGAIFNVEKLNWFNKEYIKRLDYKERIKIYEAKIKEAGIDIKDVNIVSKIESIITDRINKFSDIKEMVEKGELQYFFEMPHFEIDKFLWKGEGIFSDIKKRLKEVANIIQGYSGDFEKEKIKEMIWPYAEKEGRGFVLWPFRYALSGLEKSPDPFVLAQIFGKEGTLSRINGAIEFINQNGK